MASFSIWSRVGVQMSIFAVTAGCVQTAFATEPLCVPLLEFVTSVKRDELRELTFRTSWGRDFKDSLEEDVMYAKRCIHDGYEPAMKVCKYLMEHASVEFAGYNVIAALTCLSPETQFSGVQLHHGSFSLSFGTDDRGSLIDIELYEDAQVGGMAFHISVDGY